MRLPAIRRHWRGVLAGVLLAFIAIQLVPYGHDRVNPPVVEEPAWDSPECERLAQGFASTLGTEEHASRAH